LVADLCAGRKADEAVDRFALFSGLSDLAARQARIDRAFGMTTIQEAVQRLEGVAELWEQETLKKIAAHSPTALAAAHVSVRRARQLTSIEEALDHEYRYAYRAVDLHDFREGVRALIVDKDGQPHWRPAQLSDVAADAAEALFAPIGRHELGLA
ncbi:MAG TPA: enoyl-CoA hydratase/isomerase family protein, partial [Nordella sp.]|nr:enoyl-CoA hydratase/isomerase family protein [Nordella sp.]